MTVYGPGAIGYSAILDDVAERRAYAGWGLSADYHGFDVLVAPADCRLLGKSGWLIANGDVHSAIVVDCENGNHRGQMAERGLAGRCESAGAEPSKGVAGFEMIRFYCECCGDHQEVEIEPLTKDDLNPDPWGDIVCKVCHFVIATFSAEREGKLELRIVQRRLK